MNHYYFLWVRTDSAQWVCLTCVLFNSSSCPTGFYHVDSTPWPPAKLNQWKKKKEKRKERKKAFSDFCFRSNVRENCWLRCFLSKNLLSQGPTYLWTSKIWEGFRFWIFFPSYNQYFSLCWSKNEIQNFIAL